MRRSDHWIGFDRRIELGWLDFAAARVAEGASGEEVRGDLLGFLQSLSNDPEESGSARPKTVRVILRIWGAPDLGLRHLSDACADLFKTATPSDRLALHWAMTIAAYPYVYAHASVIGRVLGLQDTVSAEQIRQRIKQHWGDRSTVHRTSRHVVRTMIAWGVLEECGKGIYSRGAGPHLVSRTVAGTLIRAVLQNADGNSVSLDQLVSHPALFPFECHVDVADVRGEGALEVAQEGAGTIMVGLGRHSPS